MLNIAHYNEKLLIYSPEIRFGKLNKYIYIFTILNNCLYKKH